MFDKFRLLSEKKELLTGKEEVKPEKNDLLAIAIALAITVLPVIAGIFLFIALIILLFF